MRGRLLAALGAALAFGSVATAAPIQSNAPYSKVRVAMAANTWQMLSEFSGLREKLIVGDVVGLKCAWTILAIDQPVSALPADDGIPWSGTGTPGSYVFDGPVPTDAIYGRCATAGSLTVLRTSR